MVVDAIHNARSFALCTTSRRGVANMAVMLCHLFLTGVIRSHGRLILAANRLLYQFSYLRFYEGSLPFPDLQTKQDFLNSEMWTFALPLRDGAQT